MTKGWPGDGHEADRVRVSRKTPDGTAGGQA